jgi:hypothetical protein
LWLNQNQIEHASTRGLQQTAGYAIIDQRGESAAFHHLCTHYISFAIPQQGSRLLMDRRTFLTLAALAPACVGAAAVARRVSYPPVMREFLVLGRSHLFAVHRLQYSNGHNFQMVLRLRVPEGIPRRWRRMRRRDEPAFLHTAALDLRTLSPASRGPKVLQGHLLDREGQQLMAARSWPVMAVQIYAEIDPEQRRTRQLEYYLFGHQREWYGLHAIGGAADFEQVIALSHLPEIERLRLPLENNAVNARREAAGRRELHFATLPEWKR